VRGSSPFGLVFGFEAEDVTLDGGLHPSGGRGQIDLPEVTGTTMAPVVDDIEDVLKLGLSPIGFRLPNGSSTLATTLH
jgi:hypothetical protein